MMAGDCTGCGECALRDGEAANKEPYAHLTARLCVLGGIPFFCHHNQPWRDAEVHKPMSAAQFRARDFKLCAGWKAGVQELAATGYFKQRRLFTKALAITGREALDEFLHPEDEEAKQAALGRLRDCLLRLSNRAHGFLKRAKERR